MKNEEVILWRPLELNLFCAENNVIIGYYNSK